jgi:hypothetical protein
LFGGPLDDNDNRDVHVAVTATEELGTRAIILANYSRSEYPSPARPLVDHEFLRPDNPRHELLMWEAAAATSAAPTFFKPFKHSSGRSFLDGALYNNNPVKIVQKERKLLWPDVEKQHPDVLLSVGTGQDASLAKISGDTAKTRERYHAESLNHCEVLTFLQIGS